MNYLNKKQSNIICVNSIKGGAGKTTVSLSLAYTLISELEAQYGIYLEKKKDSSKSISSVQRPKVCYIDLDILGTGAKHIIYGENYIRDNIKYFNDSKASDEDFEKYINTINIKEKEFKIDCIIMSDNPEEKNKFINSARSHTSTANINIFEKRAKKLLTSLIKKNAYNYIIIDCAPSYESFSRNIYDYLIKEIKPTYKQVNLVYNLFISTLDKAHVMNAVSSVHNIIGTTDTNLHIKIVLNDTLNYLSTTEKKEEFVKKVYAKFSSLRKNEMKDCGDDHEPSGTSFKIDSIVVKDHSEIAQYMLFDNGKQINDTDLCQDYLDDPKFIKTLKILV